MRNQSKLVKMNNLAKRIALLDAIFHTKMAGDCASPYYIHHHTEAAAAAKARYRKLHAATR